MSEKLTRVLRDSFAARWTALILVAATMFFAYMFVDVLSPLQSSLETVRGWNPEVYGTFVGSEYFLNVFVFFLIFAGIILDKMGVRFTGILSASVMVLGAAIKLYGISDTFNDGGFGYDFFNSFWTSFPASAKVASIGFAIFGCGVEMAGITVSKAIVKWFSGKELALAMGLEMAIARLGVFAVFRLSPYLAGPNNENITRPVAIICLLLCIGLLTYVLYSLMDKKLDKQLDEISEEPEEPFKIKDLLLLFKNKTFLIVAMLCVLYYSAIFPFQKYATSMLESRLGMNTTDAANLFSYFPIGAMVLTPILGGFLDFRGKGATMLIVGALLMCACHLTFALAPLTVFTAYAAIIVLGISFSLVPAALWPSVPKLVENRYLGSAYSGIFWIQNIGLWGLPIIIGWALNASNPGVSENIQNLKLHIEILDTHEKNLDAALSAEGLLVNMESSTDYTTQFKQQMDASVNLLTSNFIRPETRTEGIANIRKEIASLHSLAADSVVIIPENVNVQIQNMERDLNNLENYAENTVYNYRNPMLIFASLGIFAFILGLWLKVEDKKKGYGLELPNVKREKVELPETI